VVSNPRIYIAIATFHPLVGGAEKQALLQGRSLRKRDYAATIITFRHDTAWLPLEVIEGVPIIRVAGPLLGGREKLPRFLQKLLYLMALVVMGWVLWRHRQRYDVLHVYQLTLLTLPAAMVCRFTGKPMIIAVRSADSGKKAISCNAVSLIAGPLDATASWLQVYERTPVGDLADLERLGKPSVRFACSLFRRIHAVVVILSTCMKGYLATHNFYLPNIQLIPNGVDITRFHPTHEDISGDERAQVVICIARLSYQKGIDVLLQAWHLVHEQVPQARLVIVGDGPIRNQLECMAKALGLEESVEFVGVQSDVPAQLYRGGLAVLPSRWEGMSNAVLEAMACGLPCVATLVSGSEDLIQHRVNGLVVESEDYQDMAQALLTLLRDPALAQKYGSAARAAIEQHYSLEHIIDTYVELYQRIAVHRGPVAKDIPTSETYHLPS
jgi:glycosyltransferase involved in cell wall biosynthesis